VDGSKKLVSSKFLVPSSWSFDYLHTYEFINSLALLSVFGFGLWAFGLKLVAYSLKLFFMLYFIAIVTPETINQQVLEWKNYMLQRFHCKVALKSPAHITLIPPFEMRDSVQPEMKEQLQSFAAGRQPFPIHLKNFAAFEPRVIYVDVPPNARLTELKTTLETTLLQSRRFPIKKEDRPFHPHVTIANRDLKKQDFPLAWQYFQQITYAVHFPANAITLLRLNNQSWEIAGTFPFETER
jgi:2'-5' RNA ligase